MTTTSISNMNKHIFSCIIDNQESGLRICYKKAEFLFTRLFGSLEQFQDWVILGSLNLDDFVDLHCRDLDDYERNFKVSKFLLVFYLFYIYDAFYFPLLILTY